MSCPPWTQASLGPDGLRRATAGPEGEMGRAFWLGQLDRIGFVFFEFIFNEKQFQKNLVLF
jgi:hypothetical protein